MTSLDLAHLLIGPLMLVISLIFIKYPPKRPNHYYGYRTKRSMKSQEAWEFANQFSNQLLLKLAIITSIVQLITYFLLESSQSIMIAAIVLVIGVIAILPLTENALKERFKD